MIPPDFKNKLKTRVDDLWRITRETQQELSFEKDVYLDRLARKQKLLREELKR